MLDETKYSIMVVDDEEMVTQSICTYLSLATEFNIIAFNDPGEALRHSQTNRVDLVISDFLMPKMNGLEFLTEVRRGNTDATLIMLTGYADKENAIKAINELQLFQYIEKPWDNDELAMVIRNGVEKRNLIAQLKAKVNELESSNKMIREQKAELSKLYELLKSDFNREMENIENVIVTLAKAIEAKDSYTENHADRVAHLSVSLGRHLNLDAKVLRVLYIGGLIHDIGKIGVAEDILNKPGSLNEVEYEEIKKHPLVGEEICRPLRALSGVLSIVRHHHEKLDGSGYPDGLESKDISEAAKIVAVADIYDALTSDRPYRTKMPIQMAFDILRHEARDGKLCSELVDSFIEMMSVTSEVIV